MIYSITWMLFWVLKPIGQESNSMYGISNRYSLQDKSDGEFSNDRGGDDGYDGGVLLSTLNNCPTGDLTIGQPPCPGLCRIFPDTIWRGGQTLFYHHLPCWAPELPPSSSTGGSSVEPTARPLNALWPPSPGSWFLCPMCKESRMHMLQRLFHPPLWHLSDKGRKTKRKTWKKRRNERRPIYLLKKTCFEISVTGKPFARFLIVSKNTIYELPLLAELFQ